MPLQLIVSEDIFTLEQYTANHPSWSANVTLVMESGNHILKEPRQLIDST